jgi:hypothetical protein
MTSLNGRQTPRRQPVNGLRISIQWNQHRQSRLMKKLKIERLMFVCLVKHPCPRTRVETTAVTDAMQQRGPKPGPVKGSTTRTCKGETAVALLHLEISFERRPIILLKQRPNQNSCGFLLFVCFLVSPYYAHSSLESAGRQRRHSDCRIRTARHSSLEKQRLLRDSRTAPVPHARASAAASPFRCTINEMAARQT